MRRIALALSLCALAAAADVAVRRDGRLIRGEFRLDPEKGTLVLVKKRPVEDLLKAYFLVEKEDGTHLWSPSIEARLRGYQLLANEGLRVKIADLAGQAIKARDHELARRLFDRAVLLGHEGRRADALEKKLRKLEGNPKKPKAGESERIRGEVDQAPVQAGALVAVRAQRAKERDKRLRILQEALILHPRCSPALELLKKEAPEKFPLGGERAWLDWYLAAGRHGFKFATGDELELKRALHHWRPDLYGVGSKEIFLITASMDFELVGRCLRQGDLLCRTLGEMFKTDKPVIRENRPLTVFLYGDKKGYKDRAGDYRNIDDPRFLEWSTGHWSERDDISRFYWPKDRDDERRFLQVFRRELSQHWMHARNPRYSVTHATRSYRQPGFWLEEGFYRAIAQADFDPENGLWEMFNPRCRHLDGLAAIALQQPKTMHAWKNVLLFTRSQAYDLPDKHEIRVVRRWSLDRRLYSSYHVYRDQAAAVFRYLYHTENGKYRKQLIETLIAHFRGDGAKVDPTVAFGMDADEIGMQTLEFANRVAAGWVPEE